MARVTISRAKDSEWKQKLLELRRVTRVVAGGKRMSFRVVMVIGDLKGRVGVGVAKGKDVALATEKAIFQAKKAIFQVPIENGTVPHQVEAKHSSARIIIKPAKKGRGLIAGGAARVVLAFAGYKDVTTKNLGRTTNQLTNAVATINALKKLKHGVNQPDKTKASAKS
ncbi:MAG: Ribosomal protein S5 [Parcubacteria group bacterium GW2011_GWC1_45_9]|nr:MAG: Ribosomal protein S5 [Parcubacteria group bacterium GW2011_GWA1_Parcubacteria_45_10]KKT88477.1 MAG: Ribosomal protein S5 [Parcubacteria group bacterium GW2011_GWB1_45_10]KKU17313.1 MAG: Ribosomal protein S5 [Parcubacteria group bacterium GW2011_GWC1_45_9]HCI05205.1 30S ribosomal protein S5 [Patescibacteria group bacterium]